MTVVFHKRPKRRIATEPLEAQLPQKLRAASLLDLIGAMSDEDIDELDRYLRVYQRSGIGSLAGFVALT